MIAARDAAPADASARLEALGRTYLSFATSHPGYFRVMFHGDATSSGPTRTGPARVPSLARRGSRLPGGGRRAGGRSDGPCAHGLVGGSRLCDPVGRRRPALRRHRAGANGAGSRAPARSHVCRSRSRRSSRRRPRRNLRKQFRGLTQRAFAPQAVSAARPGWGWHAQFEAA